MSYEKMRLHLEEVISRLGMAVQPVFGDENTPPFAYSIGLHAQGLPEVLVFGLPPEIAAEVLYSIAHHMKTERAAGRTVSPGIVNLEGFPLPTALVDLAAEAADDYARAAYDRSGGKAKFFQAVWPDAAGLFPWQDGFDQRFNASQPVVGTPPAPSTYMH